MSTIASPRQPAPSTSIASSPTTSRPASPAPNVRRANRSALRDYYNIKSAAPAETSNSPQKPEPENDIKKSELDAPDFDADAYVRSILASHGLEGVLKVEAGLINEIKGLDGTRKALVYDNYSKLITATDTIRRMRANMDPLTPTTGTLGMAVGYIAETAGALAANAKQQCQNQDAREDDDSTRDQAARRAKQKETVRWVLGAPKRLELLLSKGEKQAASKEWDETSKMLSKWDGIGGVSQLKGECETIMSKA